jgi:hypothetical protein
MAMMHVRAGCRKASRRRSRLNLPIVLDVSR